MNSASLNQIREIARPYAIGNANRAAGACEDQSYDLAEALQKQGVPASPYGGIFTPSTDPVSWAAVWQEDGSTRFGHCWVQIEDLIIDPTAAQFGEEALLVVPIGDSRYENLDPLLNPACW
jgi:hypothetical protein